jgi:DNA polymerase-3 subunit gamma/tau
MNHYVVLARKWRPSQFKDIVGQASVVQTLMNAIKLKRLHQAYLLTGSRGIGKTSIARIFSKAIRCENLKEINGWLESCNECSNCKEITQSNSVDVIEIDGASNNGVDAVREIRENAKFLPSQGQYKIYIIDEVHMLTTQAFNALLKTLEEPPEHVKFIFATTESHKIPATILSRCQKFDLKRVTLAQIQARLIQICTDEGIQTDPVALSLIARSAEGAMRDALSLLDQVISFSGSNITAAAVRNCTGLVEGFSVIQLLAFCLRQDALSALNLISQFFESGYDLKLIARSLIETLHASLLIKVSQNNPSNSSNNDSLATVFLYQNALSEDEWKELSLVVSDISLQTLESLFQWFNQGFDWLAKSPQPKIVFDVLVIKAAFRAFSNSDLTTLTTPLTQITQASPVVVAASVATPVPAPVITPVGAVSIAPVPQAASVSARQQPHWESFIEFSKPKRPLLTSVLEHAACLSLPTQEKPFLVLNFKPTDKFFIDQIQSKGSQEQLTALTSEFFGFQVKLQIETQSQTQVPSESIADKKQKETVAKETKAREAILNNPILTEAKALFGGELGPITFTTSSSEKEEPSS